jgi:hypothetical protein
MDWTQRDCIGSPLNTTTWVHNWNEYMGPHLNVTA